MARVKGLHIVTLVLSTEAEEGQDLLKVVDTSWLLHLNVHEHHVIMHGENLGT